ncbi:MAG TPA: beta-(1-6) glucans synthase [Bradyrhizobium sp.]|uniref:glycoside hydrolase family 17 protein n=1 Tax=Bradyrhizobium sp. TaxID=376 RepID=UPI002D80E935|nr:beta-(1-6) glucans synthase [Bradyrhizobium sp.]HET7887497.1 beta-(1-6) glucans synthase [Bradyrhizobium sp.]
MPLALLFASLTIIAAVWWWLAQPIALARAPIDTSAKLECVSYAPFRDDQTPLNPKVEVTAEQIREDLAHLAQISRCVRTYSVDNGLNRVPELASEVGLKVLLGIWIGNNKTKNAQLVDTAVALAAKYPDTVSALVVGNEVLLHGDMTPSDLRDLIRSVKARVSVPVTYADVWEYWLRYKEIQDAVDFVTIHILPYWDNIPVRAQDAAADVATIHKRLALAFPGKEVMIGETGWPSMGRMREGALPSRINQARVISEILDVAKRDNFRVNLIEAFDASWKRYWEGTVGGNWGLFAADHRTLKYPPGVSVSNYPRWKPLMGAGMVLATLVFGAAWLSQRGKPWKPRASSWIAVGVSATVAGTLLGIAIDKMTYESFGLGGWLRWGSLLGAATAAPLLSASALMSGRALPAFVDLIGPRESRTTSFPTFVLGLALMTIVVIATGAALGSVFDPRWQDLPYAALTMAAVPLVLLAWLNRPKAGALPIAEIAFAAIFLFGALYIVFIEGTQNWQAVWTSGADILMGFAMLGIRSKAAIVQPNVPSA